MLYTSTIHWHTRVTVNSSVLLLILFAETQTCVFAIAVKCMVAVRKSPKNNKTPTNINSFQSPTTVLNLKGHLRKKSGKSKIVPIVSFQSDAQSPAIVCYQEGDASDSIQALGGTLLNQTADVRIMHVCV